MEGLNEQLAAVTRQLNETTQRRSDIDKARTGIAQAKKEHLKELLEKDFRGLQLTYVAQVDKKENYER